MVTQSIPLVADLRTQNRNIGTIYLATGLVTEGDTGGGIYFWNPASTNADDGFYYLQVTGVATGRWVRIYAGSNIYNTDGSLLDNRDVALNGSYLKFIGSSANSTFNADGSVTLGSLSGPNTRMVVAGTTGTLSTQSFVPGTTIRFVEKFTAIAGQTVFNTANTLYGDLFDVFLNGVKLNTDSFSFTANQITLLDGSYAGDIIDVVGFSSVTVYATLPSQAGNAGKFLSTDGTSLSWEAVSASGFVPYIGATGNVDLGEFELKAGQLSLDVSPTGTAVVGTTRWNNTIGSSETTLKGGSVILKNGVDLVARVVNKVTPNATLTKAAYQAVRVSGAQGQRLAVAFAQANNDANSADTIGLVCETIATNQEGFIMTMGQLENINTTGSLQGETWVDGDVLYLSPTTPGAITKVKPTGAGHIVVIGYVEYAHANNGKIYVKVMNGWELDELHDVDIVSPANNEALIYESSTALWKNKTIASALGYTPISGSGVTGQIAYWNGTNSQTGSNNLFWDNTNTRLSVGSASFYSPDGSWWGGPSQEQKLFLKSTGTSKFTSLVISGGGSGNGGGAIQFLNYAGTSVADFGTADGTEIGFASRQNGVNINFYTTPSGTTPTKRLSIFSSGNVAIQAGGTFTDGGQRLQVYGDAFVRGSGATSATNALSVQDSAGLAVLKVRNDNKVFVNQLGFGNDFPEIVPTSTGAYDINGASLSFIASQANYGLATYNVYFRHVYGGRVNTSGTSGGILQNLNFTPTSGTGVFNHLALTGNINQTGGANGITRGLYVNPTLTAAADWRSIEWSNNTGWGLYGAGTANNYLGGSTYIGTTTTSTAKLTISGSSTAISALAQGVNLTNTLVAAANNDLLVALDIVPTFTSGAFTGIQNIAARFNTGSVLIGLSTMPITTYGSPKLCIKQNTTNAYQGLVVFASTTDSSIFVGHTGTLAKIGATYGSTGSYTPLVFETNENERMRLTTAGRLLLGTTTEGTFLLDVNGTARVSGNTTISLNQNGITELLVSNTTSGTASGSSIKIRSDASSGSCGISKNSTTITPYKIISSKDFAIYNESTGGDVVIFNDFGAGNIKFAGGGSSSVQMTLHSNGNLTARSILPTTLGASGFNFFLGLSGLISASATVNDIGIGNNGYFDGTNSIYKNTGTATTIFQDSTGNIRFFNAPSGTAGSVITYTERMTIKSNGRINMSSLPTSSAGLSAGDLWNDGGTLKIV